MAAAPDDDLIGPWAEELCRELGLDPAVLDIAGILDLAGRAAHAVVRPAAPVTTFIAGLVVGQAGREALLDPGPDPGLDPGQARQAFERVQALVERLADARE